MNELYINIKVDREERPDLDRLYQLAQQMLTGRSGGWPLTMFLLHEDQRPFFGGTYFPREARFGLPAFSDLLRQVAAYYHGTPRGAAPHRRAGGRGARRSEPARRGGERGAERCAAAELAARGWSRASMPSTAALVRRLSFRIRVMLGAAAARLARAAPSERTRPAGALHGAA